MAPELVDETVRDLLHRARLSDPDFIRITIDRVDNIELIPCLPVTTVLADDPQAARMVADRILEAAGVSGKALEYAFRALTAGPGPGGSRLRGAALLDSRKAIRLDPDPARGIRASHFDFTPEAREEALGALTREGLTHHRTLEALAVASKVIASGILAELCWSDDPDYAPGYVATPELGYVRFPAFKPRGAMGGRVFFVEESIPEEIIALQSRLEKWPVLITGPVPVRPAVSARDFRT